MAAVWGITEYFCRFVNGQAFWALILRLGICLVVPNALLWLVYRRTVEWKELWGLIQRIIKNVSAGGKR